MSDFPHAGRVTAVEPQKRRKKRLSVHIDGQFAFGVDLDIAEQFDIHVDKVLSQAEIENILGEDEYKRALERAFRYLAARARSKLEVRKRLREYQYPEIIINRVIGKCESLGYLDDRAFAFQYAQDRLLSRPIGQRMLLYELNERGIGDQIAEAAVTDAYEKHSEENLARELAKRRMRRLKNLPTAKIKQRLISFLRSRGFDWDLIQFVVSETLENREFHE